MDVRAICEQQLTHLSTAVIMGRQAPHKAVLLLAIMDLVEAGSITTPQIVLSKELEDAFEKEWYRFIGAPLVFKCVIATPFWHMQNEPFYSLYLNSGDEVSRFVNPYSKKRLREETYAVIDDDLFEQMQLRESRDEFRKVLINTYLQGLHSDLQTKSTTVLSLIALVDLFVFMVA
jgi:putative restriction endonuclease